MDVWRAESSPVKQTAMSVGCLVVGAVLAYGFRNYSGNQNSLAGFLLGILLLVLGIAGIVMFSKQTVIINPNKRMITVTDTGFLVRKQKAIYFDDIEEIGVGYMGSRKNHVNWYYLALKLRSGGGYNLFTPGRFYDGGSDRSTVEGWKYRLEQLITRR